MCLRLYEKLLKDLLMNIRGSQVKVLLVVFVSVTDMSEKSSFYKRTQQSLVQFSLLNPSIISNVFN